MFVLDSSLNADTHQKTEILVAQVAEIYGKALHPRGVSELNPCLPGFRRPLASRRVE